MMHGSMNVKVSYVLQKTMYGANVIIFEGILAFYHAEILKVSLYRSSYLLLNVLKCRGSVI